MEQKPTVADFFRDARAGGRDFLREFQSPKFSAFFMVGVIFFMCMLWLAMVSVKKKIVPIKAVAQREIYRESGEIFYISFEDSAGNLYRVDSRFVPSEIRMKDTAILYFHRIPRNGHISNDVDSIRKVSK